MSTPPSSSLGVVVHVDTLATALSRLGITIPASDILKIVCEEELKRAPVQPTGGSRTALLKLVSEAPEPNSCTKSTIGYSSTFVEHLPPDPNPDPLSKERRKRLREMAAEAFPPGKPFPDPYTLAWLTKMPHNDTIDRLPFVKATCTVLPLDDDSEDPPADIFEDVLCLWDTGAQTSFILASQLNPKVRGEKEDGYALMDITFQGIDRKFESIIAFRPQLPNGSDFIILGEHGLLDRFQYQVQPLSVNPKILQLNPEAWGQIDIANYADPVIDDVVQV